MPRHLVHLSSEPSESTAVLAAENAVSGNDSQRSVMTLVRDLVHLLHLRSFSAMGMDHLLSEASLLTAWAEGPDISRSLPVLRISLSAPPAADMASTMHLRHSTDPGSGAIWHALQSTTRAPPSNTGSLAAVFLIVLWTISLRFCSMA
jgi:hypothetical protein